MKYVIVYEMANKWVNVTENDIEELEITHEDIAEPTTLRNKLHILKDF